MPSAARIARVAIGPEGVALAPYHLPQDTALIADLIKHIGGKLSVLCAPAASRASAGEPPGSSRSRP